MASLRRKRGWTISDFAEHVGVNHRKAKRMLQKLDAQMGGRLLVRSAGTNRSYTFVRAVLAKTKPEYFESVESLEERLEVMEEQVAEAMRLLRRLGSQVGSNSFAIAQLQQGRGRRAA